MLVQRIIGDCPGCGGFQRFGNVFVRCDHVVRGCLRCKYSEQLPLPTLRKKILYLDQCFFSHAFRAKEKRFSEAAERLREVTALQLMVAPYSSIHEDETNQWRGHEEQLMKFIRAISFGHKFEADYDVERQQLCRAFESFLSSGSSAFQLHEDDAMDGEIHHWDEYMYITIPGYHGDVDRIRTARQNSVEALVEAFAHWRATPRTFEQQVSLEMEEQARQYLRAHVEHSARLAVGDMDALINSPLSLPMSIGYLNVYLMFRTRMHCECLAISFDRNTITKFHTYGSLPGSTLAFGRSAKGSIYQPRKSN